MKNTVVHSFREYRAAVGVFAVLALLAIGLASSDVSATGQSIAERNIQGWISQLNQDALTASRREAQLRLEQSGDKAVDGLISSLYSSNPVMRRNAAEMLGYIASPRAVLPLAGILTNDADPRVRIEAVWALSELNDPAVLNSLERASLLDTDPRVRLTSGEAIEGLRWSMAQSANRDVKHVRDLAVAPTAQNIVYLGVEDEILKSDDGGKAWTSSGKTPSRIMSLAVSPTDPNVIIAGTESQGLFKSSDGGRTWTGVGGSLGEATWIPVAVTAIAIDPRDADRIYIAKATFDVDQGRQSPLGVSMSEDSGSTWQPVDLASAPDAVTRLMAVGNTLYGLAGDRIFSSSLPFHP